MGTYDPAWVTNYFDEFGEQELERLVKTPAREIQLAVHTDFLLKHLTVDLDILEIGAGPGRFTNHLVNLECRVTVTDISPVQVELNRQTAEKHKFGYGVTEWRQLDMCDMSCFADNSFDAVVAFGGPLSYVLDQREVAIQECIRVTKPGGVILLSVMCLWGTVHQYLEGVLGFPPDDNEKIIESGDLTTSNSQFATHNCHMFRSQELREFLHSHGLDVIDMAASNTLSTVHGDSLIEIRKDKTKWIQLLEMELKACREPGCLDLGTHLIAAARKPL